MLNALGFIIKWLPEIVIPLSYAGVLALYVFRKPFSRDKVSRFITEKRLLIFLAVYRLSFAALESIVNYYAWTKNPFTSLFLPPHRSIGYVLIYSWVHYFLNAVISVLMAYLFFLFLRGLKQYQERFFEKGEVEIGFIVALVVGWPNFVVFLPLVFVSVILIAIYRRIFRGEAYTTLGVPFLLAGFIALLAGSLAIETLNLSVLKI
jgi:hypothetical protein